ncbi:site-specific DNA-methyltransferase [Stenotrophomonas sp.]|uniref:DNA-methyltransferase n=1 Tax=Stenotrophomonas sp. TaxID=69392 RepID=UPI0028B06D39|nr:site-specific DNA-methyltransferase [Stenotrophomonas sp.]
MKNELLQGDALKLLPTLPAASFDALITDPPYASGGLSTTDRKKIPSAKYVQSGTGRQFPEFAGEERDQRSHLRWMTMWLGECNRVLKEGAPVCLFTDWRQLPLTTDAMQCAGFVWRGVLVWDKTEGVRPQLGRPRNQAEYVVWGSKGSMRGDRRAPILPGVIREPIRKADKLHMTGKPTALMRQLVRICEAGGRILDPFAGSGTTLVAAQEQGYGWTGIEMTDHYTRVTRERLRAL